MKKLGHMGILLAASPTAYAADGVPSLGPIVLQLLVVLAVIGACAWLVRRTPLARRTGRLLRVQDSLPLGSRERLVVVKFEDRELLLAVNSQRITLLTERDATAPEQDDEVSSPSLQGSFAALLGQRS